MKPSCWRSFGDLRCIAPDMRHHLQPPETVQNPRCSASPIQGSKHRTRCKHRDKHWPARPIEGIGIYPAAVRPEADTPEHRCAPRLKSGLPVVKRRTVTAPVTDSPYQGITRVGVEVCDQMAGIANDRHRQVQRICAQIAVDGSHRPAIGLGDRSRMGLAACA